MITTKYVLDYYGMSCMDDCGSLWIIIVDYLWIIMDDYGLLWIIKGHCRLLWIMDGCG